jgi:hypothetical protein
MVVIVLLLAQYAILAETISGTVVDAVTKNPVAIAKVVIREDTSFHTTTNDQGKFVLEHTFSQTKILQSHISEKSAPKNISVSFAGSALMLPTAFELIDMKGASMHSRTIGTANHGCRLSGNGVYVLRYVQNGNSVTRKIFKSDNNRVSTTIATISPLLENKQAACALLAAGAVTVTLGVSKNGYDEKIAKNIAGNANGLEIKLSPSQISDNKLWPLWDPSFEESSSFGGWFKSNSTSTVVTTGSSSAPVPKDGSRLMKVKSATDETMFQYMYKMVAGHKYEVKAWIYNHGTIGIKDLGSDAVNETSDIASGGQWKQISVQFVSTGSPAYCYAKYGKGSGESVFDVFEVKDISTAADLAKEPPAKIIRYASQILDVARWKITLPINNAQEIYTPALYTLNLDPWYKLVKDKDGYAVQFRANHGGATTSGSKNPRSEYREMEENHHFKNSSGAAAWSNTDGKTHTMWIKQKVTHLTSAKPHVVVGQVHGAGDDVTVFRLEGLQGGVAGNEGTLGVLDTIGKLWITKGNDTHGFLVDGNYKIGTMFTVKFIAHDGTIEYEYNGEKVPYEHKEALTGCYFKLGNYTQSNSGTAPNETDNAYAETYVYDYYVSHK